MIIYLQPDCHEASKATGVIFLAFYFTELEYVILMSVILGIKTWTRPLFRPLLTNWHAKCLIKKSSLY